VRHGSFQARSIDSQDSHQPTARLTNLSFSIRRTAAAVRRLLLFAVAYAFYCQYTGGFRRRRTFPVPGSAINVLFSGFRLHRCLTHITRALFAGRTLQASSMQNTYLLPANGDYSGLPKFPKNFRCGFTIHMQLFRNLLVGNILDAVTVRAFE